MMALPQTPTMAELAVQSFQLWMDEQDRVARDLLGQWVSELEPEFIYGDSGFTLEIRGLGIAGDPHRRVMIQNPKFKPLRNVIAGIGLFPPPGGYTIGYDLARPNRDMSVRIEGRRERDGKVIITKITEVDWNLDRVEIAHER